MAEQIKTEIIVETAQANKELNDLNDRFESFEGNLKRIAKVSAVAFGTLTGVISTSIATYREQEQAEKQLENALLSTGKAASISMEEMKKLASSLQSVTTYGDEAILKAQSLLVQFENIGKDTMPQATEATLDLATRLGIDLSSAARMLGKALEDPASGLRALKAAGVVLDDSQIKLIETLMKTGEAAKAQKLILDELSKSVGGSARASADGTGVFIQLKNIFGDMYEELGKRLSPVFIEIAKSIKAFAETIMQNSKAFDIASKFILIGTAITGVILGLTTLGLAIPKAIAAMEAMKAAVLLLGGSIKSVLITSGIGALVIALGYLLYHWKETWSAVNAIYYAASSTISNFTSAIVDIMVGGFELILEKLMSLGGAIGNIIKGMFTLDLDTIKQGANEAANAISNAFVIDGSRFQSGLDNIKNSLSQFTTEVQTGYTKNLAELTLGTPDEINAKAEAAKNAMQAQREAIKAENEIAKQEELDKEAQHQLALQELEKTRLQSASDAKRSNELEDRKKQIENHNLMLKEKERYGAVYAKLSEFARSEEVKGAKDAANTLMQLQSSSSEKMKAVGKAAAITNAIISTHEGAIAAYKSLAGIPLVGPALGTAAAAALYAYGWERVRSIKAMAQGGLVEGGIPNKDSVPALLQPGELVVPRKNFDSVVESEAKKYAGIEEQQEKMSIDVIISLKDDLYNFFETEVIKRRALGISTI